MTDSKPSKTSKKSPRDLIIRTVVFGSLAVVLVAALLDFRAKQAAQTTGDIWRKALSSKSVDQDFLKSELSKLTPQGTPQIVSGQAGQNPFGSQTVDTYTWSGTFRDYVVKVYFALGTDPAVDGIEGPGEETPEE